MLCFLWFVSVVSTSLWPLSCFPGCRHAHWVMELAPLLCPPFASLAPSPSVQRPPKQRLQHLCRLLTHDFSVFLFYSSVLHLHPCRYCSFVCPPPHLLSQVPPLLSSPAYIIYVWQIPGLAQYKSKPQLEVAKTHISHLFFLLEEMAWNSLNSSWKHSGFVIGQGACALQTAVPSLLSHQPGCHTVL